MSKQGFFAFVSLNSKVETMSVYQGLLGKMLGYVDIVVTGGGGTREVFKAVASRLELWCAVQAPSILVADA